MNKFKILIDFLIIKIKGLIQQIKTVKDEQNSLEQLLISSC